MNDDEVRPTMTDEDLTLPEEPVEWRARRYVIGRILVSMEQFKELQAEERWFEARLKKILDEPLFENMLKEPHDD